MARVKGGPRAHARHRKIIKKAKGYWGRRKNTFRVANQAVEKAGQYAYRDRRTRRREFRRLWITRITAACRMRGARYSRFINGLQQAGVLLNRKMLSQLAIEDPKAFDQLVALAEEHASAPATRASA